MRLDITALIKILVEEKTLVVELADLANQLLQAIKEDDPNKIRVITNHQEYTGRKLAVAEQKRYLLLEEYSYDSGQEISLLSELEMHISDKDFNHLQILSDEVVTASVSLKDSIETTSLLLRQNLEYTNRMLGVLTSRKSVIYERTREIQTTDEQKIIDASV